MLWLLSNLTFHLLQFSLPSPFSSSSSLAIVRKTTSEVQLNGILQRLYTNFPIHSPSDYNSGVFFAFIARLKREREWKDVDTIIHQKEGTRICLGQGKCPMSKRCVLYHILYILNGNYSITRPEGRRRRRRSWRPKVDNEATGGECGKIVSTKDCLL